MQASDIEKLITDQIDDLKVEVQTDGSHVQVIAIGDVFEGMGAVKKQQLIYGCLNKHLLDGTIHAVVIKTFTPAEWSTEAK